MIAFLRYRYACLVMSLVLLAGGTASYVFHGGFNYHIDFVGGTELQVSYENPLATAELRSALSASGWQDAVIQSVGTKGNQFLIRVKKEEKSLESAFLEVSSEAFSDNPVEVDHISWVGGEVGDDIKWNAFMSILLSLLTILLYVGFRSQYRFAAGAVVALAHDMLAVLAIFLILNEQISVNVLAALLTTLGYSINDTIVIFSRIQENFVKEKGKSEEEIVELSINQTLRRTLLTSITTFLAVASIYLIGGEALKGFSLAMLIGIVAGTYSSVYIASPVMLACSGRKS